MYIYTNIYIYIHIYWISSHLFNQTGCENCLSLNCAPISNMIFVCVCAGSSPDPWSSCSVSCGLGVQRRQVKCKVLLSFTQAEVELPDEECDNDKPSLQRTWIQAPV